jgi:hypothetical protein
VSVGQRRDDDSNHNHAIFFRIRDVDEHRFSLIDAPPLSDGGVRSGDNEMPALAVVP